MKIGHKIRILREKRNLSQQQLAELLDESQKKISYLESNKISLTIDLLNKIYHKLKLTDEEYYEIVRPESITLNFNEKVHNGFINTQNNYEDKEFKKILIEILRDNGQKEC